MGWDEFVVWCILFYFFFLKSKHIFLKVNLPRCLATFVSTPPHARVENKQKSGYIQLQQPKSSAA